MEEVIGAEAIRGEILDDAGKKAARMLEEADKEAARIVAAMEGKAASVVEEIMRTSEARSERFRKETMARFPLERTRMRTVFVDGKLREALASYFSAMDADRVSALSREMIERGASYLSGKAVVLARKDLPEAAARAIAARALGTAASIDLVEDASLPAPGLVARAADGSIALRATMDIVEARLLEESRGELARALCGAALSIEADAEGRPL